MQTYRKSTRSAPPDYAAWEAAGLRWLAAPQAAPVVTVLDVGPTHLDLQFLTSTSADRAAARAFGAALAILHRAGAASFGAPPDGWTGDGYFGPADGPLPFPLGSWTTWGHFFAEARVTPMARLLRDRRQLDAADAAALDRLATRLAAGAFDTGDPPARIHGDLWSGNLIWTAAGAVLIDPAAHGGHHENDLALLALFGAPYLADIRAGYADVAPLATGWQGRVALHQLHCVLVHAALFGGGYASQALTIARQYG